MSTLLSTRAVRRAALAMLAVLAVLLAGCTSDTSGTVGTRLPPASGLLKSSANAMKTVRNVHFTLNVEGRIAGLPIHGITGDLTREGTAKGTITLTEGDNLVSMDFVLTADTLYLKGPTGGYQKLPASMVSSIYDPSAILDSRRGVGHVLENVENAHTQASGQAAGVDAYRVSGTVPAKVVTALLPGLSSAVPVTVWIATKDHYPVKAEFTVPGQQGGGRQPAHVDIVLSRFGAPVTITPPA